MDATILSSQQKWCNILVNEGGPVEYEARTLKLAESEVEEKTAQDRWTIHGDKRQTALRAEMKQIKQRC